MQARCKTRYFGKGFDPGSSVTVFVTEENGPGLTITYRAACSRQRDSVASVGRSTLFRQHVESVESQEEFSTNDFVQTSAGSN